MRIKRIHLNNIGPYIGSNEFSFDVADLKRNMVIIGGKNGAGKTTLFKAVKLCLYGCTAFGFESKNTKYFDEVSRIINSNEKLKKAGSARIIIDALFDDGKYNNIYTFNREWKVAGTRITETFTVLKNGLLVSETEKSDFESFLLQMLPPNLFRFYFFDGERVGDFVYNGNKSTDFKEAFLKLCGLDTIEIIKENFKRISRGKSKDGQSFSQEYDRCLSNDAIIAQRIAYAEEEFSSISSDILSIDEQLASIEKAYAKGGGISRKEWRSMQDQIAKEEIRREENRKWLKDVANNTLPFIILREQLQQLKNRIALESKAAAASSVKRVIDTDEVIAIISSEIRKLNPDYAKDIAEKIVCDIINYADGEQHVEQILNLSSADSFDLSSRINNLLAFDVRRISTATKDIDASLKCVKRIRQKMEKSSVDNYEDYLQEKSRLNEERAQKTQLLLDIEKELQEIRDQKAIASTKLAKARSDYESVLKKQSINDISARALLAFSDLQKKLYEKSIRRVEDGFKKYFSELINKSDLIDGIHIDESLNVIPYKMKRFSAQEIKNSIARNGVEFVISQIGFYAYDIYQNLLRTDAKEYELPVEVKQQLSAGEKQIFIMALYQALSQLNKMDVPYIIDTPFARIDKEHREKILIQFFTKLRGQVIVLSTDEEIVNNYFDAISDVVSNRFILRHTIEGNTEIIPDAYFGGVL